MLVEVSEREKKLIELLRQISYGRVVVFIENHQPMRVDEIREQVKL